MEDGHQENIENIGQKKVFKLRSSMKKSFRILSDSRDDSMEGCDDTLAGPRRRVSFAASNTIKPFVNDPEKITIWDNTYEELVDHTNSNSAVSAGCSVGTIDSIKQSIDIKSTSSHETNYKCLTYQSMEVQEIKEDLFLTTVVPADMEFTCQFDKKVLKTNKTVKSSSINHTMYPNADMSLTCVFPSRDMNLENKDPNGNKSLTCDDPNVDMKREDNLICSTEHPSTDMSFTCAFPNQDVNLNKDPNTNINLDNVTANRYVNSKDTFNRGAEDPNADISLPYVAPNQHVNPENNFYHKTADMSLTCVFPGLDKKFENKDLNRNKSFTCDDPNVDMNREDNFNRSTDHPSTDMSLTCAFPSRDANVKNRQPNASTTLACNVTTRDVNLVDNFNDKTEDANVDMSLTCVFPVRDINVENKDPSGNMSLTCIDTNVDGDSEDNINIRSEYLNPDMSLTCAFPVRDLNPDINIYPGAESESYIGTQKHKWSSTEKTHYSSAMEVTDVFPQEPELPKLNSLKISELNVELCIKNDILPLTTVASCLPKNEDSKTAQKPSQDTLDSAKAAMHIQQSEENVIQSETQNNTGVLSKNPRQHSAVSVEDRPIFKYTVQSFCDTANSIDSVETFPHVAKQVHKTGNELNMDGCVAPNPVATEMFSILADEDDHIVNEKCSLVDIIEEGEGHSFNLVNVRTQDIGAGFKKSASLLHFSDGFSSTQKHSNFNNTSIYNTQQLLESKSFDINDISGLKPIDKSTEINSLDKNFEPFVEPSFQTNRILDNIKAKLMPNRCRSSTGFLVQNHKDIIKESQNLCQTIRTHLGGYSPTKRSASVFEKEIKRLALVCSAASSNNSVLSNDTEVDLQDEEVDNVCSAVTSKHQKIMDMFMNTKPELLKLLYFEENNYTFSTYFSAVRIAVNIHPDDGRVVDISVKSLLNPNPQKSLFFVQNAFLVQHILNKVQMCNLKSSLGQYFDMLSLLDQVQIITDKCFDFNYEFVMIQRQFKTLKMNKDGTVSFNILHTNPPIFWTVEFQLASPETIQQNSLKVSSKWSSVNQDHFETILRNTEPGVDCIKRFATEVLEYFKRTELRKIILLPK